jgi:hypothetical protein
MKRKRRSQSAHAREGEERAVTIPKQIETYLASQPDAKRADMQTLHRMIQKAMPRCKLWFLDGKNEDGKIVTNPNIGYGLQTIQYAGGKTKDFYQIGLSANTAGISVYILGLDDKKYLARTYAKKLGKASVTGYCIKFKALKDIDIDTLEAAIRDGVEETS